MCLKTGYPFHPPVKHITTYYYNIEIVWASLGRPLCLLLSCLKSKVV